MSISRIVSVVAFLAVALFRVNSADGAVTDRIKAAQDSAELDATNAVETGDAPSTLLAQWVNWNNWGNWGNWGNWDDWNNWSDWADWGNQWQNFLNY